MSISLQRFLPVSGNKKKRSLTFRNDFTTSGYNNLPCSLTINGTTKEPTFRYEAGNATTSAWTATVGSDLAIAGSGSDPVIDEYAPGLNDKRVKFEAGKYYQCATAAFGDIGTDDFVFECIFWGGATSSYVLSKYKGSSDLFHIRSVNTGTIRIFLNSVNATGSLTMGQWNHCIAFADRSGSVVWYINGSAGTPADISSDASASYGDGAALCFGDLSGGLTTTTDSALSYVSMWQGANWLDTHLQADVAKERFYHCCGMYPQLAKGTALPTVATRSTTAYIDKIDSNGDSALVPVGAEWLRSCKRIDKNGDYLSGYLAETQVENIVASSQSSVVGLVLEHPTDVINADASLAPDGTVTAYDVIADLPNQTHGGGQDNTTLTAAAYTFSCWAKAGNKDWFRLDCATADANAYAYFDIKNGTVGTVGSAATARISNKYANDFYRVELTFTGTAASNHYLRILSAEADNDETYSGDGSTVNSSIWGVMCHLGNVATSYIKTVGATATRTKDQLRFIAGENIGGEDVGRGTIECILLSPDVALSGFFASWALSDGGSTNDRILSYSSGDTSKFVVVSGGVSQASLTGTTDLSNGVIHPVKSSYAPNNFRLFIDGGIEDTDSSGAVPDDIDNLYVGMDQSNTSQLNGLISRLKIYKKPV